MENLQTLIHADIFFFITSVAVVIVTILAIIAAVYVIYILRTIKQISQIIRDQGDRVSEDIDELRDIVRHEGASARSLWQFFLHMLSRGLPDASRARTSRRRSSAARGEDKK